MANVSKLSGDYSEWKFQERTGGRCCRRATEVDVPAKLSEKREFKTNGFDLLVSLARA